LASSGTERSRLSWDPRDDWPDAFRGMRTCQGTRNDQTDKLGTDSSVLKTFSAYTSALAALWRYSSAKASPLLTVKSDNTFPQANQPGQLDPLPFDNQTISFPWPDDLPPPPPGLRIVLSMCSSTAVPRTTTMHKCEVGATLSFFFLICAVTHLYESRA